MSWLTLLGIWIAISVVVAPVAGWFLAGESTHSPAARRNFGLDLGPRSRRRA